MWQTVKVHFYCYYYMLGLTFILYIKIDFLVVLADFMNPIICIRKLRLRETKDSLR